MKKSDFYFDLPESLIAQGPSDFRGDDRLLVINRKKRKFYHSKMTDLKSHLPSDSVMVFNDTKVRKARVFAISESGSNVEFLFLCQKNLLEWQVICSRSRRNRIGKRYYFPDGCEAKIIKEESELKVLLFSKPVDEKWFEQNGHVPLPPYIKRTDLPEDSERYQTVYAKDNGSVAAPTAGLHFTQEILSGLENHGIKLLFLTLHVGLGTFLPVRTEDIDDHQMHTEKFSIPEITAKEILKAKKEKKMIIGVGTTSVRTLESAWNEDHFERMEGETNIFIKPGYKFKVVDNLFTNLHTPESTLLMLVSAFAGRELILSAYSEAISSGYKFFSYGDAMLIL